MKLLENKLILLVTRLIIFKFLLFPSQVNISLGIFSDSAKRSIEKAIALHNLLNAIATVQELTKIYLQSYKILESDCIGIHFRQNHQNIIVTVDDLSVIATSNSQIFKDNIFG